MIDIVKKMLAPLARRVGHMVVRGLVELVDDGQGLQSLQVSLQSDFVKDQVERFQQFGFTGVPSKDAECIVVHVGGDADHPIVIAVDDRSLRPTGLSEGESAQYTKQDGKRVYAKADGSVEIGTNPTHFPAMANLTANWLSAVDNVLRGPPIPEPGMGSPSALQTALLAALAAVPVPSESTIGATQVKVK